MRAGLTLVELLVVMAIVATLAAMAFGLVQGATNYAALSRARADLSALSQALQQYRRQFGDYPETAASPEAFYQALAGRSGPTGAPAHGSNLVLGLPVNLHDAAHPDAAGNYFMDPWDRPYQYVYFTRQEETVPPRRGFVLYSFGPRSATEALPTRAEVVPDTEGSQGGAIAAAAGNAKNIYAGQ